MPSSVPTNPSMFATPGSSSGRRITQARAQRLLAAALACAPVCHAVGSASSERDAARSTQPGSEVGRGQIDDPLAVTGQNFAGVRLPLGAVPGQIELAGQRAWVWAEPASVPGQSPTRRVVLSGDVRVVLGNRELHAARASVWLQRLESRNGRTVYQVYAYFDRVSTPTAAPPVGFSADTLPVEGVIEIEGSPELRADLAENGPVGSAFVERARSSLADRLRVLLELPTLDETLGLPLDRPESVPGLPSPQYTPDPDLGLAGDAASLLETLADAPQRAPIFADDGVLTVGFGPKSELTVVPGEGGEQDAAVVTGGVTVLYEDLAQGRTLQMQADRGVVFVPPGTATRLAGGVSPADVRGIYLEGAVEASDGNYTLRGPRVYYDLASDRGIVLDGVLSTFDARRRLPLYARADVIRQESARQFAADEVTLANTAFFRPQFSIGAESVTLTLPEGTDGAADTDGAMLADARSITLRAGQVPFLYWPIFRGDPQQPALRGVSVDNSTGDGFAVKTTWDVEPLLNVELPEGVGADLLVDGFFSRGAALGTEIDWNRPDQQGKLFAYTILNDQGQDRLRTGRELEQDGDTRGIVLFEHRQHLDERWTVWLDAAYASDETFVDAFFDELQRDERELTTGGVIQRREGNSLLELEARTQVNDFIVNDAALQTPGFVTERLPEGRYIRQADDLLGSAAPGVLTLFSEYRAGLIRANANEATPTEQGFDRDSISQLAFGIDADETIAERLELDGVPDDAFARLDTRQEVVATLNAGPVRITPFTTGRVTFYDERFEDFGDEVNDRVRLWGGAGITLSTTFQAVFDRVRSRALDLHRLRHVVEPSITAFHAGTNTERGEVPVFDNEVDRLVEGSMVRIGLDQRWQTQRGGPGRWRSVDVVTLDAELVLSSDTGQDAPIGRFFPTRPELSRPGDFGRVRGTWQLSDAIGFAGEIIYDFEQSQQARTSGGILIDHSPTSRSSIEYRFLNVLNESFLDAVNVQQLGDRYTLSSSLVFDLDRNDLRRISTEITREFQSVFVGFGIGFDNIQGTTSFGFSFQPKGFGSGARLRGIGTNAQASGG